MTEPIPPTFYGSLTPGPADVETPGVTRTALGPEQDEALRARFAAFEAAQAGQPQFPPPTPAPPTPAVVTHVKYGGREYEIDQAGANSLELIEAMVGEDIIEAIRVALTPDAYKAVRANLKDAATGYTPITSFTAFLEAFTDAVRPTVKQPGS